jgi:CDP-4-dehydro-6-deoxyglucose reductase
MIGGGTGYAPLKAMIREVLDSAAARDLHLFWGVRTAVDLYDDDWLRALEESHPRFHYTPVPGGFVHEAVLGAIPDLSGHDIYAAGPPAMIEAVRANLPRQGADPGRIYIDSFDYAPV